MIKKPVAKIAKSTIKSKSNASTSSIAKKPTASKTVDKSTAAKAFETRAQKFVDTKKAQETKREQNSMYRTSAKPNNKKRTTGK
jgi:hypothetical protein